MRVSKKLSKEQLEELYVRQGKTAQEIANIFNINKTSVLNWLHSYQIPIKHPNSYYRGVFKINIDEEILRDLYLTQKKTLREIALILKVPETILSARLRFFKIPARKAKDYRKVKISKEEIVDLYVNQKQSLKQIAKKIGCDYNTLSKTMSENGISIEYLKKEYGLPNRSYRKLTSKLIKCDICSKEFRRPKCWVSKNYYCSRVCAAKGQSRYSDKNHPRYKKKEYPCPVCGDITLIPESQARNGRKFCGKDCFNAWKIENPPPKEKHWNYQGGTYEYKQYGPSWWGQRKKALIRDNYTCQKCGKNKEQLGKNPDVHHRIPARLFQICEHKVFNKLENLACYCNVCHRDIEIKQLEVLDSIDPSLLKYLYNLN